MRKNKTFKISTLSAAIAATIMPGYATAQQTNLEEVIVTATRRSESLQDIPINITALSSTMIERDRLTDLSDIARVVPGMTVIDQGPRSGNILTVRGLNVSSISASDGDNTGGGTVGTYIGEIPLYIDLKLNDMERVEVLMGPQGTLYGAGTMGGAVRYIPNKPQTDTLSYQVRGDVYDLGHSDDAGYEGGGTINIPLIEDSLAFRASVDYLDDPGFIDYNYLVRQAGVSNPQPDFSDSNDVNANLKQKKDANTEETWSGRAAVRYTSDMLDGTLSYYYQDQDIGGRQINSREAFGTGKYESALRFEEPNSRKNELLALELIADLGFAELTSATGYSEYSEHGHRDQTDLLLSFEYGYEFFPSFSAYTSEQADEDTFTQELRLVSTSEGPLSWIAGAFYNNFDNDATSEEFTPEYDQFLLDNDPDAVQLRPDSLEFYQSFKEHQTETAVFGELGYQFTDAWQVTVGARWFKYDYEATNGFDLPLLNTVYGRSPDDLIEPTFDTGDADDDDVIFKFNTSYDFSDDIMGYLTISEGYRLGASNGISLCPVPLDPAEQDVCAQPDEATYKSDTSVNYEIGVHSQFSDSVIFNGAVYYIDWDDVQLQSVTVNGALPIIANGDSAESYGIELNGQWYITPELSISGSYAYTNAQLAADVPGLFSSPFCGDGSKEDPQCAAYSGDRLPGTPENQFYLAAHYEMPLSDGSQLNFDTSVSAQSDVLTKAGERDNGEKLSGFALYNISTTWLKDDWQLTLYADNVFDEYAETGVRTDTSFIRDVGDFTLRRYYQNMVRPRQVGLKFIYNFED